MNAILVLLAKVADMFGSWFGDRKQRREYKKTDRTAEIHSDNAAAIDAALDGMSDGGSSGDAAD